jgi:hypothetical protein
MRKQVGDKTSAKVVIETFCPLNRCENKEEILGFIKGYQKQIKDIPDFSHADIRKEINAKVSLINDQLGEISVDVDKGWFNNFVWDSSDPSFDDKAQQDYSNYSQTYVHSAGSGFGKLLMTDHLRKKVGHLKSKEDDITEVSSSSENTTEYFYEEHTEITDGDIELAINDAYKAMEKQGFRLNLMNNIRISEKADLSAPMDRIGPIDKTNIMTKRTYNQRRLKDIKRLVKTNPAAVGELLINYPELSSTICEAIGLVQDDDDSEEFWDDAFFWGGLVVGGVLLGGGLIVMGGMLLARGAAATAFYSTLGTGVTTVGLVTGTIESVYWGNEVLESQMNITLAQMSFIAGLTDESAIEEVKLAMEDMNNSIFNLALSLGFTAVDVAAMYSIIRASKISRVEDMSGENIRKLRLVKMKEVMNSILVDNELVTVFLKLTKKMGKQKIARYVALLGNLSDATLKKSLIHLNTSGVEKASEFIEKSLKTLRGCS